MSRRAERDRESGRAAAFARFEEALAGMDQWSRRRWMVTTGVIFVGQVVAICLLGARVAPLPARAAVTGRVALATVAPESAASMDAPWRIDPAEFALVGPRSFSGRTWLSRPQFEQRSAEWMEPPRTLEAGADLGFAPTPALALPRSFFSLREPPEPAALTSAPRPLVATNSTVWAEGLTAARSARLPDPLPVWEHPDVLQPSIVQVTLDENGAVLAATLLASSGLAPADAKAIELARQTEFTPLPAAAGAEVQWPRLVFAWRSVPPGGAAPR